MSEEHQANELAELGIASREVFNNANSNPNNNPNSNPDNNADILANKALALISSWLNHLSAKHAFYASLLVIFLLIFTLNSLTPLWGDDWWRALRPENFFDMFKRLYDEYMGWTGRIFVLFLTFIFLLNYPGSELIFNLVNSAVFCVLLVLMFRASTGRYPGKYWHDVLLILCGFFLLWFFTKSFGEAVFWKTGAIAYLWVVAAAIFLLLPFVELIVSQKTLSNSRWRLYGLPAFAFFWAITLENVAVSVSVFMIYALLFTRQQGMKLDRWYMNTLIAQLVGTTILIIAPGNFLRAAAQDDGNPLWYRMGELTKRVWQHVSNDVPLFFLMAALLVFLALQKERFVLKRFFVWLIIGLMFAFSMVGSTGVNFDNRTAFVAEVVFILALLNLVSAALFAARRQTVYLIPLFVLLGTIWCADIFKRTEQSLATWQQDQRRDELMAFYRANELKKIILPSIKVPYVQGLRDDIIDKQYFLRDIHAPMPGNEWRNGSYAYYKGFEFATRIPRAYAIFEEELTGASSFVHVGKFEEIDIYTRKEAYAFKRRDVLYLISARKQCMEGEEITVYPLNEDDLPLALRKAGYQKIVSERNNVFIVAKNGEQDLSRCMARYELPKWPFQKIEFQHRSLSLPDKKVVLMSSQAATGR